MIRRLYRLLLYLYPAEFRERFGEEMIELAHQQRRRPWLLARDILTSLVSAHTGRAPKPRPQFRGAWSSTWKDFELAVRGLWGAPGFAAVAIATIALGIGANTAIFSVVHSVVLRALPFEDPDGLVTISSVYTADGRRGRMSLPDVDDIRESVQSVDAVAPYGPSGLTLTGLGEPEVVRGARVGAGLLETFRLAPVLGRDIRREENVPNGARVVVIGHRFWQERLGGHADVLGQMITLGGEPFEIVGVAPPGFDFPDRAALWQPAYQNIENCGRGCHNSLVVARLASGATVDSLQAELSALAASLADEYEDTNRGKVFRAITLSEAMVGSEVRTALFVLLGAVGVVLLIASANVAHLLLARASGRTGEMATRSALGATRFRLVRQLLVESFVLAALGGVGGVALARWAVAGLVALAPPTLPRLHEVSLDGTVLLFACSAIFGSCFLFGLAPAVSVSRTVLGSSRPTGDQLPVRSRSRSLLLAGQVALSLVLLFGAALLLRSLTELRRQALGFDEDNVLTFTLLLADRDYPEPEHAVRFFETLEENLAALPAVDAVGSVFGSPMSPRRMVADITFFDRPAPPPGEEEGAVIRAVTPGYAQVIRVPLERGRFIDLSDRQGAARVLVVNEIFAEHFFPGRDPLGQKVRLHGSFGYDESEPRTIIGVVGNVRSQSAAEAAVPEVWAPQAQMGSSYLTVAVRSRARELLPSVTAEVRRLDPNLPLRDVELLSTAVERSFGATRFYSLLLTLFAVLAVILASVGFYGVISYLVSQRTREIGLRMALGANARDVSSLVLAQGLRPACVGIIVGIAGALAVGRLLASMLYHVTALDTMSLVSAALILLLAASAALTIPARRASSISPLSSLRVD